jgi:hypothetical protein
MPLSAWAATVLPANVALPPKVTVSPLMALATFKRLAAALALPS